MASDGIGSRPAPPDQGQRDRILGELDRCLLVEAAAGTGKTTSMVGRMVALIRSGAAVAPSLAAVTFTRKAAAELRGRFQLALEAAVDGALGEERERLEAGLRQLPQCYVGTIHSFCARLLRERPVEAGVDLAFEELDEDADARLRGEAWSEFAARLLAADEGGVLGRLDALGLRLADLAGTFRRFADYPDIAQWPCPDVPAIEVDAIRARLNEQLDHMRAVAPRLPAAHGTDTLIPAYRRLPRIVGHLGELDSPVRLTEALALFRTGKLTQKVWLAEERFTRDEAKAEKARWDGFVQEVVEPTLRRWREQRYATVIEVLLGAERIYDQLRADRGQLNFQDLLLRAAGLLRDQPHVRRYFAGRLTHLLVDEFQDTDPIQAEVMLLLTAADTAEVDWRRCRPRPGSLFVVGDPKQSIYRFRRADIVTYNEVKRLIVAGGGDVVSLSANFRCTGEVVAWVNRAFGTEFPPEATPESPSYIPLDMGRTDPGDGDLTGVFTLTIPAEYGNQEDIAAAEADRIARTLRKALDERWTVSRPGLDSAADERAQLLPSDVLIVTKKRARLQVYARALQAYGIPHQVTGGAALNEVRELALLHTLLRAAVHVDDPVALVGALRSELFGISDVQLYELRSHGGLFSYRVAVPDGLDDTTAMALRDSFATLKRYAEWLATLPPVAAIERIVADSGLMVLAASRSGGDVEAGSLGKAIEILRTLQRETWSPSQLVDALGQIVNWEQTFDGVSARSADPPRVRIMNLHKAKGLEAPVVFLADPSGEREYAVDLHVDRSGDEVLGYLSVSGPRVGWQRPLLALPRSWEQHADRELAFQRAEAIRLRYVAATRGGSALIISCREKSNKANPWAALLPSLSRAPELDDPGAVATPTSAAEPLAAGEVEEAVRAIESRLVATRRVTHGVSGAKEYALSRGDDSPTSAPSRSPGPSTDTMAPVPGGAHGSEWGSAIHSLLELAMLTPGADLERLARATLDEFEIDPSHTPAALDTVRAVMRSDVWQRAMASERRLPEAPFQVMASDLGIDDDEVPTLLRGTVDLIFREPAGWVLVDYKTDAVRGDADLHRLVAHYAPQVQLYARAWERCCGEPVVEAGLYFSRVDRLVTLKDPRGG